MAGGGASALLSVALLTTKLHTGFRFCKSSGLSLSRFSVCVCAGARNDLSSGSTARRSSGRVMRAVAAPRKSLLVSSSCDLCGLCVCSCWHETWGATPVFQRWTKTRTLEIPGRRTRREKQGRTSSLNGDEGVTMEGREKKKWWEGDGSDHLKQPLKKATSTHPMRLSSAEQVRQLRYCA